VRNREAARAGSAVQNELTALEEVAAPADEQTPEGQFRLHALARRTRPA